MKWKYANLKTTPDCFYSGQLVSKSRSSRMPKDVELARFKCVTVLQVLLDPAAFVENWKRQIQVLFSVFHSTWLEHWGRWGCSPSLPEMQTGSLYLGLVFFQILATPSLLALWSSNQVVSWWKKWMKIVLLTFLIEWLTLWVVMLWVAEPWELTVFLLENVMLNWAYSDFRAKTGYHYSNNDLHLR